MRLKEIATEAGVSVMTVSNVINQNYTKVSKDTVKRVNAIIKKYNYVPNLSARSLSAKKSNIITILVPISATKPTNIFEDPYIQQMIGNIEFNLSKRGYFLMLKSYSTTEEVLSLFHNWNISGAIMFYPSFNIEEMALIANSTSPIVVIDKYYDTLDLLTVDLDDFRGGYLSAKYLLQSGHTRIGFACPYTEPSLVVKNRFRGFHAALKQASIAFDPKLFFNSTGFYESGISIGKKISTMKNPPTAISTTLDRLAIGLVEGLRLSGLSVPEDISVIGFDNWPVLEYVQPKLTTIAQDFMKKSDCITDLLIKKINNETIENSHITLGVELIERNSVNRVKKCEQLRKHC